MIFLGSHFLFSHFYSQITISHLTHRNCLHSSHLYSFPRENIKSILLKTQDKHSYHKKDKFMSKLSIIFYLLPLKHSFLHSKYSNNKVVYQITENCAFWFF